MTHYENRMMKPTGWKQQLVDSRGKPIYQPFSEPGIVDLSRFWETAPIDKHWRLALAKRRLAMAIAQRP